VYPGTGDHSTNGFVVFDPGQYKERPGLLLLNGTIYTAWSSHCDIRPYTGWIIGYDNQTLTQTSVLNITPNGNEGSIWMSGGGLAADSEGNIFFLAANGTFDTNLTADGFPSLGNYGNAFIKVSTANGSLSIVDYFAPTNTPFENAQDGDLGSGGAVILPDMVDTQGNTRQLAVGAGKDQNIYLVDRANMGKFNPVSDAAIYQEMIGAVPNGVLSTPAFFNGTLYYGAVGYPVKAFPFQNAQLMPFTSQTANFFEYPGATPSISANGQDNAILWATDSNTYLINGALHAYAATNLAIELYNSNQAGARDHYGGGNKFITPTIASARVYVGTPTGVGVLGLLDQSILTPLQIWRDNHFRNPSNVGAGADDAAPAGDGIVNLIKYAIGLDPLAPTNLTQIVLPSIQQNNGETYGTVTLNRFVPPPDVTYLVEVSSDLSNWSSGPGNTVVLTDVPTQLVVRDATPLTAGPRFMRLRVSNP
jgi:hypothetical protein